MSWLDLHTSLYNTHSDNTGRMVTFRGVLFTEFGRDMQTIYALRLLDPATLGYEHTKRRLKNRLQCYTPSGSFISKASGNVLLNKRTPLMQLDFDNLHQYDIDEFRAAVFDFPFVAFTGLSVSGNGLFALVMIEEPERLADYAEHCFYLFEKYNIPIDTGKGQTPQQLRYVSYDSKMMWRDHPHALKIKRFNSRKVSVQTKSTYTIKSNDERVQWAVNQIQDAQIGNGNRFETVRKVAFTMGGFNSGLYEIKQAIKQCSQYAGVEAKYLKHADECFNHGKLKPFAA